MEKQKWENTQSVMIKQDLHCKDNCSVNVNINVIVTQNITTRHLSIHYIEFQVIIINKNSFF